mmetsp:Transcript_9356/g.16903  ORF Transcript_9356/g.16903 Transcript_9356/m.16903 type:complete len:245 (+) Transcript_9356:74-808(+)
MATNKDNNNGNSYEEMSTKDLRILLTRRGYDWSNCLEKSELVNACQHLDAINYDDEAQKLFRELNLTPTGATRSRYSKLDAIWKHPTTEGSVYVGNYQAAMDRQTLRERNIVAIVNCQDVTSRNFFEDDPDIFYHRFVVSRLAVSRNTPPLEGGFQSAFDFCQDHLERGHSVLIHCLAGAHRAGTMGVAWLMLKTNKGVQEALTPAKVCRPIINPFGTLMGLLHRLESELDHIKNDKPQQSGSS